MPQSSDGRYLDSRLLKSGGAASLPLSPSFLPHSPQNTKGHRSWQHQRPRKLLVLN